MADEFSDAERASLNEAIKLLGALRKHAPELRAGALAVFDSCELMFLLWLGTDRDELEVEDFWAKEGGEGELSDEEVIAMQELAVALRRVVNGCVSAD